MSVEVSDVYDLVCETLLENGGLQLGILTDDQFLDFLDSVTADFLRKTAIVKDIFTVAATVDVSEYAYPAGIMRAEAAFYDNAYIERSSRAMADLDTERWPRDSSEPETWSEDRQDAQTFSVSPPPPDSGKNITLIGIENVIPSSLDTLSTITEIPKSFTFYLFAGVMNKIRTTDGELKDDFQANYFWNRYMEGVNLAKAIMGELSAEN